MNSPTKTRRRFTAQQEAEAVQLCLQKGLSRNAVAQHLGLPSSSLTRCVRQARIVRGQNVPNDQGLLSSEEREERNRLRKKHRELRREKDFFRLVAAHFANEQLLPNSFACSTCWLSNTRFTGCAGNWAWPEVAFTPGGSGRMRRESERPRTL